MAKGYLTKTVQVILATALAYAFVVGVAFAYDNLYVRTSTSGTGATVETQGLQDVTDISSYTDDVIHVGGATSTKWYPLIDKRYDSMYFDAISNPLVDGGGHVVAITGVAQTSATNTTNLPNSILTGGDFEALHSGQGTLGLLEGISIVTSNAGTSTVDAVYGVDMITGISSSGRIKDLYNLSAYSVLSVGSSGNINNNHGLYIWSPVNLGSGAIGNNYGIYIQDQNAATSTNYSMYVTGTAPTYHGPGFALDAYFQTKRTPVDTVTYTVSTSTDYMLAVSSTGAAVVISLPSATSVHSGHTFIIKDRAGNAGSKSITATTTGANTIDGRDNYVIGAPYGYVTVVSDGVSNWETISN